MSAVILLSRRKKWHYSHMIQNYVDISFSVTMHITELDIIYESRFFILK